MKAQWRQGGNGLQENGNMSWTGAPNSPQLLSEARCESGGKGEKEQLRMVPWNWPLKKSWKCSVEVMLDFAEKSFLEMEIGELNNWNWKCFRDWRSVLSHFKHQIYFLLWVKTSICFNFFLIRNTQLNSP